MPMPGPRVARSVSRSTQNRAAEYDLRYATAAGGQDRATQAQRESLFQVASN